MEHTFFGPIDSFSVFTELLNISASCIKISIMYEEKTAHAINIWQKQNLSSF